MSTPPVAPATPGHARSLPIYIGAGFVTVAGHYAVTITLVELAHAPPLAASAAGFCAGAAIKYVLNYFVAFRSVEKHGAALAKFAVTLGVLFVLNALFFALLHQVMGLHYIVAQVLTTGLLIAPGYLLSRLWVFAAARSSAQSRC
jgi:putative flippase GtrA